MKKNIYNIGLLNYFFTTIFGKNRQIITEIIEWKDKHGETKTESSICDYIITIGKKAIIITTANPNNSAIRLPLVVKSWKQIGKTESFIEKISFYRDVDGHFWKYLKDNKGEIISYYDGDDYEDGQFPQFNNGETKFFHFEVHSM